MAHRLLREPEEHIEDADFPIVCETCLGPNPFVRMQKIPYGGACHISERPYTVFRWKPGHDARYKKTIICQQIAKAKNVCQVCLLDLDYGLPVQVRDTALGAGVEDVPQSEVGKEYQLTLQEAKGNIGEKYMQPQNNETLAKLARTTPYYKRNRPKICSFWVKGECNRGAECPFLHEEPVTGELAKQDMRDRYYGINDPVAKKMLKRAGDMPELKPPVDMAITTLYIGDLIPDITDVDLRAAFSKYGKLTEVSKARGKNYAFVTFESRAAAEKAAGATHNRLFIKSAKVKVLWGRRQDVRQAPDGAGPSGGPPSGPPTGQPRGPPGPHFGGPPNYPPPGRLPNQQPPMGGQGWQQPWPSRNVAQPGVQYASQDPEAVGSRIGHSGTFKRGPEWGQQESSEGSKRQRSSDPAVGQQA